MRKRRLIGTLTGGVLLACGACGGGEPGDNAQAQASSALITFPRVVTGTSNEVCKVSNQDSGGVNPLACDYAMYGADLGIPVYDGTNTWVLFGDAIPTGPAAWNGGADATGYFAGTDPEAGLCGGLSLVSVPGLASRQTCGSMNAVFAPDPVSGSLVCNPPGSCHAIPVGDYVFQPALTAPAGADPLPANSEIPGDDEVPTGAYYRNGQLLTFYQGAPWWDIPLKPTEQSLPVGSVSYLTAWVPSTTMSQPFTSSLRNVVAKVDYNLANTSSPTKGGAPG